MTAEEHIRAGDLDSALLSVRDEIRKNPSEPKLRIFLFQLLSVNGDWEKALTQLNLVGEIGADCMVLAQIFRPLIQCEALRAEVFLGKRSPLIFGEPQEWIGLLVHANSLLVSGNFTEAREIVNRALEAAPAVSGSINEHTFEWIADADSRLGPILEAVIDGKYYWVPFNRVRSIAISRPTDLRDLVWISATFTWANGGESSGMIPVRYAESEKCADSGIRLARKTEWRDVGEEFFLGSGQRIFATDQGEYPLLESMMIKFDVSSDAADGSGGENASS